MKYRVSTFRAAGLEARWIKQRTRGPAIVVRWPGAKHAHQREEWWVVSQGMWTTMEKLGIVEGFDSYTMLGNIFSLPA